MIDTISFYPLLVYDPLDDGQAQLIRFPPALYIFHI